MSIPVQRHDLAGIAALYQSATLITVPESGYPRILTVDPEIAPDGTITLTHLSQSVITNSSRHPEVTLVWQPQVRHGWTLVVDGMGELACGGEDGPILLVTPDSGMLHRPSQHADGPEPPRVA